MSWKITKEQNERLLYYMGCGNLPEADILFLGNEEGAGGYNIEANVEARYQCYGTQNGELTYAIDPGDYSKGYWEPSGISGRDKIIQYLRDKGESPEVLEYWKGGFLRACALICNVLESGNVEYWNQKLVRGTRHYEEMRSYILNQMLRPRNGIQSALIDLRHLPRENEKLWYPVEYEPICSLSAEDGGLSSKNNRYLKAYSMPKRRWDSKNHFTDYAEDVETRLRIIKEAFTFTKAEIVIALGGANGFKKVALERIFGNDIFSPLPIQTEHTSYRATVNLPNKELKIYLIPFPDFQVFQGESNLRNFMNEFLSLLLNDYIQNKERGEKIRGQT